MKRHPDFIMCICDSTEGKAFVKKVETALANANAAVAEGADWDDAMAAAADEQLGDEGAARLQRHFAAAGSVRIHTKEVTA